MVMTPNVNPYSLAKQNDNKVYSNRVISVMKKTVLFVFCGFYDWRSKSKQFVRKLITLWMCSDLLICKAAGQKIFTEVLLGLMVKARRSAQCWCSAEQYEGALGSAWVRDGEHTLQYGLMKGWGIVHLSMCLLLCGNMSPVSLALYKVA